MSFAAVNLVYYTHNATNKYKFKTRKPTCSFNDDQSDPESYQNTFPLTEDRRPFPSPDFLGPRVPLCQLWNLGFGTVTTARLGWICSRLLLAFPAEMYDTLCDSPVLHKAALLCSLGIQEQ